MTSRRSFSEYCVSWDHQCYYPSVDECPTVKLDNPYERRSLVNSRGNHTSPLISLVLIWIGFQFLFSFYFWSFALCHSIVWYISKSCLFKIIILNILRYRSCYGKINFFSERAQRVEDVLDMYMTYFVCRCV